MLKVAVTGNIASGKSLVQKYIEKSGIHCIDADDICRDLLANDKDIITSVQEAFKDFDITENGNISRKKLSDIIFQNSKQKKLLEGIIHPKVKEEIDSFIKNEKHNGLVIVFIPLLFETGMDKMFDKIIFISAGQEIRLKRLERRNALSRDAALRIISSQRREEEKIPYCHFVLHNNSAPEDLYAQIDVILPKLLN